MVLGYNNDDGAQALDQQQEIDFRRGWQVVNAAGGSNLVTAGTGSYDVDVAAGDINTPSGTVTCSAATLDLESLVDPDLPRIVTVYRDASGVAQTLAGTPAAKQPEGETAPGPIYQPAPDAFSTTDGVVLATVLLEAAASSVGSAQIRDRRMPASLNVDSAEFGSVNTEGVTMYVAPDGDDNNGGLSPSDPLATINAAISQAPIQGDQSDRLRIDVADGTIGNPNSDFALVAARDTSVGAIEVVGGTSNGDPSVTLDAEQEPYVVAADGSDITLRDVELTNASVGLRARLNATINLVNTHITAGDTTRQAYNITHGAAMFDDADCRYDVTASTEATDWVGEVNHAQAKLNGTHVGDWVRVKEGARVYFTPNFSLDADGSSYGIWVYYGSTAKIGAVSVFNADTGIRVEGGSHYSLSGVPNFGGVNNKWSGTELAIHNDRDGDSWAYLPEADGQPDLSDVADQRGVTVLDTSNGHLSYRSPVHPGWMETGRRRLESQKGYGVSAGSKQLVENQPLNDRMRRFEYHVTDATGDDWSLTLTKEGDGNGNLGYYLENTGTDDVTIRYIIWETDME